jgi:Flp pilus assembly protein TadG
MDEANLQPRRSALSRLVRQARSIRRNQDGTTAIEFALVALPFFMLVFGIISIGLYFFVSFSTEYAAEQASRQVRTGNFRAANANAGMTTRDFKNLVCSHMPQFVDCAGKVRVFVTTIAEENAGNAANTGFSGASSNTVRPPCVDGGNGNLVPENTSTGTRVTAAANSIVMVSVCYQFDLAGQLPFLRLGGMTGSSSAEAALIRAATVFRTEPF